MTSSKLASFTSSAKGLSKNPLGIMAIFIVLVYGFACLLFGFSAGVLRATERLPLIWFLILFPLIALSLFAWLVSKHHNKLCTPQDFSADKTLQDSAKTVFTLPVKSPEEIEKNISDMMKSKKDFAMVSDQIKLIKAKLSARKVDHKSAAAKVLIHSLAIAQVNTWFEKTYYLNDTSHISLLKTLSELTEGMPDKNIQAHFKAAQNNFPEHFQQSSLTQYISNLLDENLIEQKDGSTLITQRGADFLNILAVLGYWEDKPL